MRDPLHWVPIRFKLTLMFVGVCLLAFGVGGYLVSAQAKEALQKEVEGRLDFQSRAYGTALDGQLRLLARRTQDFASDGYIRDRVQALVAGGGEPGLKQGDESLEHHLLVNKLPLVAAFIDLSILAPDGEPLCEAVGRSEREMRAARDDWGELADPWYSGIISSTQGAHSASLVIRTAIRSREKSELVGYLVAWVDPRIWVSRALAERHAVSDTGGLGWEGVALRLTDGQGWALHVDRSRMPLTPSEEHPDPDGLTLRVERATPSAGAGRTGALLSRHGVERSFAMASSGWRVTVHLLTDDHLSIVAGLQSRFLALGIGLALGASLLLFFPMRFLARHILRLVEASRRIQGGDFSTRVVVDSTDELGELGSSFNLMAQAVEERTSRLRQTADDLRERQQDLRRERDRLGTVISSMRDGVVVMDGNGEVILRNAAAGPLVGVLERDGVELKSYHNCKFLDQDSGRCGHCFVDMGSSMRSCVVEFGHGIYEVHATSMPAMDSTGEGRVLVSRDITDRVSGDEREIHQERLAVLGEVAAVMAHELNNPLAAISLYNQMMGRELEDDSPLKEHVEVVQRNIQTCKRAIRDLLDYATDPVPDLDGIDLHDVIQDVATFLRPIRERAGVELQLQLDAPNAMVNGDEIQLRQVFVNLVLNAIQAMDGDGEVCIRTSCDAEGVIIDVSDDGPGIPTELHERIFRPFFSTKARGQGTGLGLPTSRRIIEMNGGTLRLTDSSPNGTSFRVRLRSGAEVAA